MLLIKVTLPPLDKYNRFHQGKFYVIKVPYAHQEDSSSSSSSSSTMRKKKGEEKVEHLIPISVQKAQTCNHFTVLDGKLYFVANDLSLDAPVRTSENSLYREVWTFDLHVLRRDGVVHLDWKLGDATRIPLF